MPAILICKRDMTVIQKFDSVNLEMTVLEFKKTFLAQNDWASKCYSQVDSFQERRALVLNGSGSASRALRVRLLLTKLKS